MGQHHSKVLFRNLVLAAKSAEQSHKGHRNVMIEVIVVDQYPEGSGKQVGQDQNPFETQPVAQFNQLEVGQSFQDEMALEVVHRHYSSQSNKTCNFLLQMMVNPHSQEKLS